MTLSGSYYKTIAKRSRPLDDQQTNTAETHENMSKTLKTSVNQIIKAFGTGIPVLAYCFILATPNLGPLEALPCRVLCSHLSYNELRQGVIGDIGATVVSVALIRL